MQKSLEHEPAVNVGEKERIASIFAGTGLILVNMLRPNRLSISAVGIGAYLLFRGIGGRCLFYQILGINRVSPQNRAGIQVEKVITIARPRQEVYQYWRDFSNLPNFMRHLKEVKVTGPTESYWVAQGPFGSKVEWLAEMTQDEDGKEIAWRSLPGSDVTNQGRVKFQDAPGGRGTEVHVTLSYLPPSGKASAVLARLFGNDPESEVREDLRSFKAILETGETPTIKGQTSGRLSQVQEERDELVHRHIDVVEEASMESFPASDAPGWVKRSVGRS